MKKDDFSQVRGGSSVVLDLTCFKCNAFIAKYQKDGPGPLKRSYLDRFLTPIDGTKEVVCECGQVLGIPGIYKPENRPCICWFQSALNKSKESNRPQSEEDIDAFLEQVKLIESCTYLQFVNSREEHPIFKLHYKKGEDVKITTQGFPERESTEAFLMRLRPLVTYEEELHIGKVATFVFEGKGEEAEKRLQLYRNGLKRRNQSLFSIFIDEQEYTMQDFMWMNLFGKYFHLEREKRIVLEKMKDTFGPITEATALGNLEIYANIAIFLARDIEKMRAGEPFDEPGNVSLVK
jgi:hypothetical protein